MFALESAAKRVPQRTAARTGSARPAGYHAPQQEPDPSPSAPKFRWNIGGIAASARVQTKLAVGPVDDPLEHEADRVAAQVLRMPAPRTPINTQVSNDSSRTHAGFAPAPIPVARVQRQCSCGGTCSQCRTAQQDKEHGAVQRKPAAPQISRAGSVPASSGAAVSSSVHDVLRSPGRPLDDTMRAFMEPRFGYDFSSVRVHSGEAARSSATDVGALAYTVGRHIVFREESPSRALFAHELAHVMQQASMPAPLVQRAPGDPPKFFDPSRGGLTGAERAKLLDARRRFHLPDAPTASDTSIVGVLITETGEELRFHSGEFGGYQGGVRPRADIKRGPGSGTTRVNRTHVETWAINLMRKLRLKKAVLLIELEPCSVCGGYDRGNSSVDTKVPGVSAQLPKDAQLIIVDGDSSTFFSHAPSDPLKSTKAPKNPPKPRGKANTKKDTKKAAANVDDQKDTKKAAAKVEDQEGTKKATAKAADQKGTKKAAAKVADQKGTTKAAAKVADQKEVTKAGAKVEPQKEVTKAAAKVEPQKEVTKPPAKAGADADATKARTKGEVHKDAPRAEHDVSLERAKNTDFKTEGTPKYYEGVYEPPPTMSDPYASAPALIGEGLANILPEAMSALQDRVIQNAVAHRMLDKWSIVDRVRSESPNDWILWVVSLEEWEYPDPAGQVARMVNYVEVYHGATKEKAMQAASQSLKEVVPKGWREVGPFLGWIGPADSLSEAKDEVNKHKGCFIATACYGSALAPEVSLLRRYRDLVLHRYALGRGFIRAYYRMSPPLADFLKSRPVARWLVRNVVLRPIVALVRGSSRTWYRSPAVAPPAIRHPEVSLCNDEPVALHSTYPL